MQRDETAKTRLRALLILLLGFISPAFVAAQSEIWRLETELRLTEGQERLAILMDLAEACLERGKHEEASSYATWAVEIARRHGEWHALARALRLEGAARWKRHEYSAALASYHESLALYEELETRFHADRKEMDVELLRKQQAIDELELERRTHTRRVFVVGFGMALVLLLLVYGRSRYRVRTQRTIERKNQKLEDALEKLRESEKRYRRLFKDPMIGKLVIDPIAETVLDANVPARSLLDYTADDLTGVPIADLGCSWLHGILHRPPGENNSDSRSVVEAFEHVIGGERRFFEAWISPLNLGGRPAALLTLNDVTERRRLEEERVRQQERERYIAELEEKKTEVEARNAEMERFTYTVSHDLKSPLFTIRGFLGMLKKDTDRGDIERVERDIDHISTAAAKMGHLLDELLELSRVGRVANPSQEVSVAQLARESVEMLSKTIAENRVRVEIATETPIIFGDRERLREVIQNLIENACKFMGDQPEPRIEIAIRQEVQETVYFVRDNGIGIDPRYHDKVFGLFDRLDPSVDGSGIGLALVKRIVEVHGGRIWIESEGCSRGTTFCFTLRPEPPESGLSLATPAPVC